jgi:Na+/proline symporter
MEDWQIFRTLDGANPVIYLPSLIKWALFGLVFFGAGIVLVRSKSPVYSIATKRLVGLAYFLAGILLLISVAFGTWIGYSLIELGIGVFGFLLVVQVIGFLGPYLAIPGIKQTFVENFCEERLKAGKQSITAVSAEPADDGD